MVHACMQWTRLTHSQFIPHWKFVIVSFYQSWICEAQNTFPDFNTGKRKQNRAYVRRPALSDDKLMNPNHLSPKNHPRKCLPSTSMCAQQSSLRNPVNWKNAELISGRLDGLSDIRGFFWVAGQRTWPQDCRKRHGGAVYNQVQSLQRCTRLPTRVRVTRIRFIAAIEAGHNSHV